MKTVLGVTGGVAAYKAVYLLRRLQDNGADVRVVMTESAKKFVGELTFSALSGHAVFSELWAANGERSAHVQLANWADAVVVAPCSANTLAKLATGLCDNALVATVFSAHCPVVLAPAMDLEMYRHPSTHRNMEILRGYGYTLVEPETGYLASGLLGQGRMPEPETLLEAVFAAVTPKSLAGLRVVVTAGPTVEALDPVRFLSNHSTGKMGYALAAEAARRGARTTLVSGPVQLPAPYGVERLCVTTARQMFDATTKASVDADVVVKCAAVADFRPANVRTTKIKKNDAPPVIELVPNPDILLELGKNKKTSTTLVGFALETDDEITRALSKLRQKNADLVVLNSLRDEGAGFGGDSNVVTILDKHGGQKRLAKASKSEIAKQIWNHIIEYRKGTWA